MSILSVFGSMFPGQYFDLSYMASRYIHPRKLPINSTIEHTFNSK